MCPSRQKINCILQKPFQPRAIYISSLYISDSKIYAMGGYDGRSRLNSCERYDPANNQWEMLPSMHRRRSDASSDSLAGKVTSPDLT